MTDDATPEYRLTEEEFLGISKAVHHLRLDAHNIETALEQIRDEHEVRFNGRPVAIHNPNDAPVEPPTDTVPDDDDEPEVPEPPDDEVPDDDPPTVPAEPKDPAPPPAQHTGVSLRPMKPVVLGYDATIAFVGYSRLPGLTAVCRVDKVGGEPTGWGPMTERQVHGITEFHIPADLVEHEASPGDVVEVRAGDRTIRQTVGKLGDPGPHGWDLVQGIQVAGNLPNGGRGAIFEDCTITAMLRVDSGVNAWFRRPWAQGIDRIMQRIRGARDRSTYSLFYEDGEAVDCGDCWGFANAAVGCNDHGRTYGDAWTETALVWGCTVEHLESFPRVPGQPEPKHADGRQQLGDGENIIVAGNTIANCISQPLQHEKGAHVTDMVYAHNSFGRPTKPRSGAGIYGPTTRLTIVENDWGNKVTFGTNRHDDLLIVGGDDTIRSRAPSGAVVR